MPAYYPRLKRFIDILGASFGVLMFALPMIGVAILIRLKMGGPVIFRQLRSGRNQQNFVIYKFRTMSDDVDATGFRLSNQNRVTTLGRFLRKTSLDELPQLFNVLKGDMSLVGPRPLLGNYIPFYSEDELRRFDVLPGITGLAQIEGRHNVSWDVRLANDVFYVKNKSFILDLKIIIRTVGYVLRQRDVVVAPADDVAHLNIARAIHVASGQPRDEAYNSFIRNFPPYRNGNVIYAEQSRKAPLSLMDMS